MLKKYDHFFSFFHCMCDFFIIGLISILLFHPAIFSHGSLLLYLLMGDLVFILIFNAMGFYQSFREKSLLHIAGYIFLGTALWLFCLKTLFWLTRAHIDNHLVLRWVGCVGVYFGFKQIGLMGFARFLRKRGYNTKKIVLIGDTLLIDRVHDELNKQLKLGYSVIEKISDSIPGQYTALDRVACDQVWIAYPLEQFSKAKEKIQLLRHSSKEIRFITDISDLEIINQSVSQIGSLPIINIRSTPMSESSTRLVKAIEDRILALLILLLISPLMLIIAALVKYSSTGPIFYRQMRMGMNGKIFEILKFRSMPVDAEQKSGAVWAKPGENRATKIGTFLRKTSLDELPQFINVLKGDMSIVGPRPERPELIEKFKNDIPSYMQKHLVKAGITGLAQINGFRGNTDLQKRIEYDLQYIQHWSLWLDIKIIFLTVFKGFSNENAY